MLKNLIVINEQHKLLKEQKTLLEESFESLFFETLQVPADGWSLQEMEEQADSLLKESDKMNVVFISPVPVFMAKLCFTAGYGKAGEEFDQPLKGTNLHVFVLHNDHREKKELPNGKVISVVASTGWELVEVK